MPGASFPKDSLQFGAEENVQGIPLPYQEVVLSERVQELVKIISLLF